MLLPSQRLLLHQAQVASFHSCQPISSSCTKRNALYHGQAWAGLGAPPPPPRVDRKLLKPPNRPPYSIFWTFQHLIGDIRFQSYIQLVFPISFNFPVDHIVTPLLPSESLLCYDYGAINLLIHSGIVAWLPPLLWEILLEIIQINLHEFDLSSTSDTMIW